RGWRQPLRAAVRVLGAAGAVYRGDAVPVLLDDTDLAEGQRRAVQPAELPLLDLPAVAGALPVPVREDAVPDLAEEHADRVAGGDHHLAGLQCAGRLRPG